MKFAQHKWPVNLTLLLFMLTLVTSSCALTVGGKDVESQSVSLDLPTAYISTTPTLTATETPTPSATPTPTRTPLPTQTPTIPPTYTASPTIHFECPGTLTRKLNIGDQAQVNYYQVSARSAPGFSSRKEHVLARGRVVDIIAGPQCVDKAVWWQIHFAGTISSGEYLDYQAWMPEVDNDTYYLVPVP